MSKLRRRKGSTVVVAVFSAMILGVILFAPITSMITEVNEFVDSRSTYSELSDYVELSGTVVNSSGYIELNSTSTSGYWLEEETYDDTVLLDTVTVDSTLSSPDNQTAEITVRTKKEDGTFDSITSSLNEGVNEIDISSLEKSDYIDVKISLTRDATTVESAEINSYELTGERSDMANKVVSNFGVIFLALVLFIALLVAGFAD